MMRRWVKCAPERRRPLNFKYFTKGEYALWGASALSVVLGFLLFDRSSPLTLVASLIGVTSLIFCAKGNPIGQALTVVFSVLYAVISYGFSYYGEMITYLGMTLPMAVIALLSWLKNPYGGKRSEVTVNSLSRREGLRMLLLSLPVTVIFYFILRAFGTASLIPSTVSVTTSFLAVYLCFRRSALYALAYAANDAVLLILWGIASLQNTAYVSVFVCFFAFLANDIYATVSWRRMAKRQGEGK